MTRSSLRLWAQTGLLFVFIACAKAEGGSTLGDGDGDGDGPSTGGTVVSSSGGVVIGSSGGRSSVTGGAPNNSTGGASPSGGVPNLGGAGSGDGGSGTGGSAPGTGGADFDGQCAGLGGLSSVEATGDRRVHTCTIVQSNCVAEALGVPALFECVATHVPNCFGQGPDGGTSWDYIGLCSETALGGASN